MGSPFLQNFLAAAEFNRKKAADQADLEEKRNDRQLRLKVLKHQYDKEKLDHELQVRAEALKEAMGASVPGGAAQTFDIPAAAGLPARQIPRMSQPDEAAAALAQQKSLESLKGQTQISPAAMESLRSIGMQIPDGTTELPKEVLDLAGRHIEGQAHINAARINAQATREAAAANRATAREDRMSEADNRIWKEVPVMDPSTGTQKLDANGQGLTKPITVGEARRIAAGGVEGVLGFSKAPKPDAKKEATIADLSTGLQRQQGILEMIDADPEALGATNAKIWRARTSLVQSGIPVDAAMELLGVQIPENRVRLYTALDDNKISYDKTQGGIRGAASPQFYAIARPITPSNEDSPEIARAKLKQNMLKDSISLQVLQKRLPESQAIQVLRDSEAVFKQQNPGVKLDTSAPSAGSIPTAPNLTKELSFNPATGRVE